MGQAEVGQRPCLRLFKGAARADQRIAAGARIGKARLCIGDGGGGLAQRRTRRTGKRGQIGEIAREPFGEAFLRRTADEM